MALRLKSRQNPPPNGFMYHQRQTNWRSWQAQPTTQWDFKLLCRAIQEHRERNPKFNLTTDLFSIANEVDYENARRVSTIPGAQSYLIDDAAVFSPPKAGALLTITQKLAGVAAGLSKVNAGRVMLLDWEAAGYPQVEQSLAEQRATVCVSCPKNGKGDFTRWFTVPAADRIKKQIERLKQKSLSTTKDNQLGVCEVCLCPLKLKMHAPLAFIAKYVGPEMKNELAAVTTGLGTHCWVIDELSGK